MGGQGCGLEPELRRRAAAAQDAAAEDLAEQGEREAEALRALIAGQARPDFEGGGHPRRRADEARRGCGAAPGKGDGPASTRPPPLAAKLEAIERQIESEPARLRESYAVKADRVEIVGLLYLLAREQLRWPRSI